MKAKGGEDCFFGRVCFRQIDTCFNIWSLWGYEPGGWPRQSFMGLGDHQPAAVVASFCRLGLFRSLQKVARGMAVAQRRRVRQ